MHVELHVSTLALICLACAAIGAYMVLPPPRNYAGADD